MPDPATPSGLAGARVVVTGAGGGIGSACVRAFAHAGATVAAVDVRPDPLRHLDGASTTRVADLADPTAAEATVAWAWDRLAGVDVLVNAGGRYPSRPLGEVDAAQWDEVMAINARAPLLLTVAFSHRLVAAGRGGAVVNVGSGAARRARAGTTSYAASKAALEAVTRSCALELAPHDIRVNTVAPGYVHVDSPVNPIPPAYAAAAGRATPLGRSGVPDDVVPAILWLASPEARWVTGATLPVDGGAAAGSPDAPSWH